MREISESILLKNVYRIMIGGMDMSKEVERLQELIDQYDNIVFFGGEEFLRRAGSRIFEARTDFIIRSMIIRRKLF